MKHDLRELLLLLYLKNNPKLAHQIYIYSYLGITDVMHNPFQLVGADLPPNMKKSIILQNIPAGEMLQAFISPVENGGYEIENSVIYGNKTGVLVEIGLDKNKIDRSGKYRQFQQLADSMLRQFRDF
ncbi:Uncharacterised protein [Kingella potus]|uniref:Uncharacterized protein n=1 Tax=Kingella potus TaxID=265175 RepID=A0A377R4B9_9NEIS|nr:hypothetical protein [Kingella potus]UOP00124.1 hypothetical protein LVJ84_09180 [Kingella potus]STR02822.1 Uncharacterised protein [Kingella potus]